MLNLLLNYPDQNISNQFKPKKLLYIKSLGTEKTGVTPMRSDGQITADTKQKSNITNSVSRYSPWNHKTISHTIKTALPIALPGVKKLLHNINTHKSCAPKTIKLFGSPIFRF